jgi:alpha-D-ribose 1-methylphosphonate 5-triphosphate synthase subunit PhnH
MTTTTLHAGLGDPVHDSQRAFRAALQALARPGHIQRIGAPVPGVPLGAAMAQLLLTLADEDTPLWWQRTDAQLAQWLRFHTGAGVAELRDAQFAVVLDPMAMPPLEAFAQGTLASPEFSCTLLIEVRSLHTGPLLHGRGPGIRERAALRIAGLHDRFWSQWQANHASFPQGVDLIFTSGDEVLGLPRTTRVEP